MKTEINEGRYKNLKSVVLENSELRIELVPEAGARTASIIYKPLNTELLWQNPEPVHAPVEYAQPFPEGEKAGFDEMFPTINECLYPDAPWKEAELPDHGEVWALPWGCEIDNADSASGCASALLTVSGVRLPYRLTKRLRLEGATLKAVYRAENLSPHPMAFLYAAHPLFNVDAGDRIIVPGNLSSVINAVPSGSLPDYGREYAWPGTTDNSGASECGPELSVMPQKNPAGFKKYYFAQKNTEGWSALRRSRLGLEIRMSCSADKLPWLGIWMNEGGWDNQYNLALEPSSASMDDLKAARTFNQESILEPNEVREWKLDIAVNKMITRR